MSRAPSRGPRYPYRPNPPLPHHRRGELGENVFDAKTGDLFPAIYAVETPDGPVDGRNGAALDLDTIAGEHEGTPDNYLPVRLGQSS